MSTNSEVYIPIGTVTIDECNVNSGIVTKEYNTIYNINFWHKIIVRNVNDCSRNFVLSTIMNTLNGKDFTPVCYTVDSNEVSFLLKSCGAAIRDLCKKKLSIPFPDSSVDRPPLKLVIVLRYAQPSELKVDVQGNILHILRNRYDANTKILNLEAFGDDTDLLEFFPLSQPKLFYFVLSIAKDFNVVTLKVNNNEIADLASFKALYGDQYSKSLLSIDLSCNKIKKMDQLRNLTHFPIKELILDENPICDISRHDYIKLIKKHCPNLSKLDGEEIHYNTLLLRRNFLCSDIAYDIINEFVEHYFTLYDSNRENLEQMYHRNAMFSVTCQYLSGQTTSIGSRLADFRKISRNLKLLNGLSKSDELLFYGTQSIMRVLSMLPKCQHDPYTFTVDLTNFTDRTLIFTITGVFRDLGQGYEQHTYGFTRSFVLISNNGEYNIVNEQFFISNATTAQHSIAFKEQRSESRTNEIPNAETDIERDEMIKALAHIVGLYLEWAKKCLEECEYNLKRALILCLDLIHSEQIPSFAFSNNVLYFSTIEFNNEVRAHTPPCLPTSQGNPNSSRNGINESENIPYEMPVPVGSIKPEPMDTGYGDPIDGSAEVKNEPIDLPEFGDAMFAALTPPLDTPEINEDIKPEINNSSEPILPRVPMIRVRDEFKMNLMDADEVIKDALNIPVTSTQADAKFKILKASSRMVKEYTYHTKYYRAVGREFYRYKLYKEARIFLDDILAHVPRNMGEEIFSAFALNEIQFGDLKVAEQMLQMTVVMYPINKTIKFLGEYIAQKNVEFARKMFIQAVHLNISQDNLKLLFSAYRDFEKTYGTIEDITKTNSLQQQILNIKEENLEIPMEIVSEPEIYNNEAPTDRVVLIRSKKFNVFRTSLLHEVNVGYKIEKEDVKDFLECKENILEVGISLINKYPSDINVYGVVCHNLWTLEYTEEVLDLLDKSTNPAVKNLLTFYKIRRDLQSQKTATAFEKVIQHIRLSNLLHTINLIEDLIVNENEFAGFTLEKCTKDKDLPISKRKLLSLQYLYSALLNGHVTPISKAEVLYKELHHVIEIFHPDDVLRNESCQKFRNRYEKMTRITFSILEATTLIRNSDNIDLIIEATRSLYFYFYIPKAREEMKMAMKNLKTDNKLLYQIALIHFEAFYGEIEAAMKIINKMDDTTRNSLHVKLALTTCYIQLKDNKRAKNVINSILKDMNQLMDPNIQEGLYKYYNDWITKYEVDLYEIGLSSYTE